MKLFNGYDKRKSAQTIEYRNLTKGEILALCGHAEIICNDGRVRNVKINGKVRTWKRDADRIEVPVKYGLYEYHTLNLTEALARFVVRGL